MLDFALRKLRSRDSYLRLKLQGGTAGEIARAREQFRLSLVELYELGYWRERPDLLRGHMRLFRACRSLDSKLSAPRSMSAPDKMAQYSP
jgi:hypothetical protein